MIVVTVAAVTTSRHYPKLERRTSVDRSTVVFVPTFRTLFKTIDFFSFTCRAGKVKIVYDPGKV